MLRGGSLWGEKKVFDETNELTLFAVRIYSVQHDNRKRLLRQRDSFMTKKRQVVGDAFKFPSRTD